MLLHIPTFLLGFFIIVFYVLSTILSLVIIRKFYPYDRCKNHNDIAGFIFATLGVIYAVILAFTVVVSWNNLTEPTDVTDKEADCIASLYQDTMSFPAELRARIKVELTDYVNAIVNDEWQTMKKGKRSASVDELQDKTLSVIQRLSAEK